MFKAIASFFLTFTTLFSALNKSANALNILAGQLESEAIAYGEIRTIEREAELNSRRKALKADLKTVA